MVLVLVSNWIITLSLSLSLRGFVLTDYNYSVESQGRTLEQLEWVYNQPKPVQASLKADKVVVQADGKVTEKIVSDDRS